MGRHLFLFSLLAVHFAFGQQLVTLSGTVIDGENNPIVVGDVLLYDQTETALLHYAFISEGSFLFSNIPIGDYVLKISALGFADAIRPIQVSENLSLQIIMAEEIERLEEVAVTAVKKPIVNNNGNLKIDVQHPIFSSIPESLDVLAKLPNVLIAPNRESVNILGKGSPLIYLGGQRIDFEEFIALSVDAIESIELINNPSAKYEANGRAVLKITLKRKTSSNTFTLSETASIKRNFNNYLSANSNFALGKSNVRGNFAYNQLGPWESNTFRFAIPAVGIVNDYLVLLPASKRREFNGGLGWYYPLSTKGHLSLNTNFRLQKNAFPIETDTFLQVGAEENVIVTNSQNTRQRDYVTANFNFEKPLDDQWNLFSGLQFSSYLDLQNTEVSNNVNGSGFNLDEIRDQSYRLNSLAFRMDFAKKVSAHTTWEIGLNWNNVWANAFSTFENITPMQTENVDFRYDERLYATYVSFASKLGEKITYSLGLRSEYNRVRSTVEDQNRALTDRETTTIFPKAAISIPIDSVKTLSVNYAKSINRPNFSRTSTVATFINPFLEGVGNSDLRSSITDEVTASLQWGDKSISVGVNRTQNPSNFTIRFDESANVALFLLENQEKESGFFVNLVAPFSKGPWSSTNSIALYYNAIEDGNAEVGAVRPYLYTYTNHQFKIAKDTTLAVGAWALTKRQEGIFQRNAVLSADATISKTFFKKLQCSLRFNDIFRTQNFEEAYNINGVLADGTYFADAREMALSLKYRFGADSKTDFKNKDVDQNLGRIK